MADPDLKHIMRLYSKRGYEDWKKDTSAKHRQAVRKCFASAIADSERDVDKTIGRVFDGECHRELFIPMPKCPSRDVDWCFFLPMNAGNEPSPFLQLFLLIKCTGNNWLAFRFETGAPATRHGYSHVQFTRRVVNAACTFGPQWLPCKDPAFLTPARDPLEMFLAMVVAVHGVSGGLDTLLLEVCQEANHAREYKQKLNRMLDPNA